MLINFFVSGSDLILAASEEKLPRALGKIFCLVRPQKNLSPFDNAKVQRKSAASKYLSCNFLLKFVNKQNGISYHYSKISFVFLSFSKFCNLHENSAPRPHSSRTLYIIYK
jgi:hypothetical protein